MNEHGSDDHGSPTAPSLRCMEVWGSNRAIDDAVSVPGLDVHVLSEPYEGEAAGGDVHYVSLCGGGNIARTVLADVSGHGEAVAELADALRKMMRQHLNTPDQSRFARRLNAAFAEQSSDGLFATAVLVSYYAPSDSLIVCNAGHPTPLWYRADTGEWSLLTSGTEKRAPDGASIGLKNLPLGIIEPLEYEQFAVRLSPGDVVVLYTDALTEATLPDGSQLGEERLLELVRGAELNDDTRLAGAILERVRSATGEGLEGDDRTLVVLRHNAGHPPAQSLTEKVRVLGKMLIGGGGGVFASNQAATRRD